MPAGNTGQIWMEPGSPEAGCDLSHRNEKKADLLPTFSQYLSTKLYFDICRLCTCIEDLKVGLTTEDFVKIGTFIELMNSCISDVYFKRAF